MITSKLNSVFDLKTFRYKNKLPLFSGMPSVKSSSFVFDIQASKLQEILSTSKNVYSVVSGSFLLYEAESIDKLSLKMPT